MTDRGNKMKLRRLGNSGLLVSELALGTMIFGEDSERGVPPAEARRIIARYLEMGGNHFDIANVYAGGRAEEIVGEATATGRDGIVICVYQIVARGAVRHIQTEGEEQEKGSNTAQDPANSMEGIEDPAG